MRAHNNSGIPRNTFLSPLYYISMLTFNEPNSRDHAIEMIKLLLDSGADPFLPCDQQTTILHRAFDCAGIIQPFLDLPGLDLERRDARGRTLLLAASSCATGTYSYACRFSQLPRMCGMTSAVYEPGDLTRAMTLYERGVDLTAIDNEGNNTIHLLVSAALPGVSHNQNQHGVEAFRNTVVLFLDEQPHLRDQRNTAGETPGDIARRIGNQWAVEVLQAEDDLYND